MIPKSFLEARKLYDLSVNLANSWISKYYPGNNYQISGVPLEKIQAFSQHVFFSGLITKKKNKRLDFANIWNTYPTLADREKLESRRQLLSVFHALDLLKIVIAPRQRVPFLSKVDVVILSSGRHLKDLGKVVARLHKNFKILVIGKISEDTIKHYSNNNVNFINVRSGQLLFPPHKRFRNLLRFRKLGQSHANDKLLVTNEWRKRLSYLKLVQLPEIASLVDLGEEIFIKCKPSLLLTTSSNDILGAALCLTARKLKIPTVEILHGFTSWHFDAPFFNADYQLVWGKMSKKLRRAYLAKSIISGCPFLEKPHVPGYRQNLAKKSLIRLLILWSPPFGSVALFQTESNQKTAKRLVECLAKLPKNFTITLRSHPSYDLKKDLEDTRLPSNIKLSNVGITENVIKKHDVVITQPTTAGFIAALHKKPLLFFNNSWITEKYGDPFTKSKSALNVPLSKLENINRYVLRLIDDKELLRKQILAQEKFVNDYCSYFGEESCNQIVKFVKKFTKT